MTKSLITLAVIGGWALTALAQEPYLVLATQRTGTMQNELTQAAERGYVLVGMFGGETAFGGAETVAILEHHPGGPAVAYRLLATSKTSTMQDELNQAAAEGFVYVQHVIFNTLFGGEELVLVMERVDRP